MVYKYDYKPQYFMVLVHRTQTEKYSSRLQFYRPVTNVIAVCNRSL